MSDTTEGHPPAALTLFFTIVTTIITASLIIALQGYFNQSDRMEETQKITSSIYEPVQNFHRQEHLELGQLGWTDTDTGMVRIPVQRASEAYLQEWNRAGK